MKSELLCFKYVGVPRMDEMQKSAKEVGWKCRKYIRWALVHERPTDRIALKKLGDDLVDNAFLQRKYYPDVSDVFFNVQKWRCDKDNLSVEPPRRANWEELRVLIETTNDSPALFNVEVQQYRISLNSQDSLEIQEAFWIVKIVEFFNKIDLDNFSAVKTQDTTIIELRKFFYPALKTFLQKYLSTFAFPKEEMRILEKFFSHFDFKEFKIHDQVPLNGQNHEMSARKVFIEYCEFEKTNLLKVVFIQQNISLKLNRNHLFTKKFLTDEASRPLMETFLKAFALSYDDMASNESVVEQFTKYLGLNLLKVK